MNPTDTVSATNATVREAAAAYIAQGWQMVPLLPGEKRPVVPGWTKRTFTPDDLGPTANIGVKLGLPSGGLVDTDLDCPEAVELAREFFPATGSVFGRSSKPASHLLYICHDAGTTKRWNDATGKVIVELRSNGGQTMVPPSRHPSGEAVEWLADEMPTTATWAELVQCCEDLADAVRGMRGQLPAQRPGSTKDVPRSNSPGELRPGDDFQARGDLRSILLTHGWEKIGSGGQNEHWRRPGKTEPGTSATFDGTVFYVFSSNAAPFQADRGYNKFQTYAILEHAGDYSAAAKALAVAGYGTPRADHPGSPAGKGAEQPAQVAPPAKKTLDGEAVVTRLADVVPVPISWLWPHRIARGKLTLLVGDPGLGKSFLTLDLASRISKGLAWPDCNERDEPGGVVLLSAEDDLGDTIRPRLDAAGADVGRIVALTTVKRHDLATGKDFFEPFSLAAHLPALEGAIRNVEKCRLLVIDPISAYLGGTDSHKNADVRGLLMPLSDLAARTGVAVIAVSHLRKGEGPALYRAMGSLAFVAAARAAYVVTKDQNDSTGQRRLFLPVKNNLGNDRDGLAFALSDSFIATGQPIVRWELTAVSVSADDAMRPEAAGDEDTSQLDEAVEWLRDVLADGPMPAKEIYAQAKDDGFSKRTVQRAKTTLGKGVRAAKDQGVSHAGWTWTLLDAKNANPPSTGDLGVLGNTPS